MIDLSTRCQCRSSTDEERRRKVLYSKAPSAELNTSPGARRQSRALLDHRWLNFAVIIFFIAVLGQTELLAIVVHADHVFVAWLWSRSSLRVFHARHPYRRFFPVKYRCSDHGGKPQLLPISWLQVEDEWPVQVGPPTTPRPHRDDPPGIPSTPIRCAGTSASGATSRSKHASEAFRSPAHLFLAIRSVCRTEDHAGRLATSCWSSPAHQNPAGTRPPAQDPWRPSRAAPPVRRPQPTMGIRDHAPHDSFRHVHGKPPPTPAS